MTPYYADTSVTLYAGDCLDVLAELPAASVDAVVTDPPYGLEFMGKTWDAPWKAEGTVLHDPAEVGGFQDGAGGNPYSRSRVRFGIGIGFQAWCQLWATECLRVLKPGGHLLAFGGTRTWHRLACAVEDAGFEVRDSIAWLYGSGFPKSLDVSKAIDKIRDWTLIERLSGEIKRARMASGLSLKEIGAAMLTATDGTYGTWYHRGGHMFFETGRSLPSRPEFECLLRVLPISKDFVEVYAEAERAVTGLHVAGLATGTSGVGGSGQGKDRKDVPATPDAVRWQGWGTALKPAFEPIVVARKPLIGTVAANVLAHGTGALNVDGCRIGTEDNLGRPQGTMPQPMDWGNKSGAETFVTEGNHAGRWPANVVLDESQADALDLMSGELSSGSRNAGTYAGLGYMGSESAGFPSIDGSTGGASRFFYTAKADAGERVRINGIAHPTVKPLALMRWLVRLVTPPGGTVLEPFAGSGTTVEACILEGFRCIAIEREADYLPLITQRLHRRLDPVQAVRSSGDDGGLFDLLDGGAA